MVCVRRICSDSHRRQEDEARRTTARRRYNRTVRLEEFQRRVIHDAQLFCLFLVAHGSLLFCVAAFLLTRSASLAGQLEQENEATVHKFDTRVRRRRLFQKELRDREHDEMVRSRACMLSAPPTFYASQHLHNFREAEKNRRQVKRTLDQDQMEVEW